MKEKNIIEEVFNISEENTNIKIEKSTQTEKNDMWSCKICYEDLTEPVVTQCGHIYCWECIYTWYTTKSMFINK